MTPKTPNFEQTVMEEFDVAFGVLYLHPENTQEWAYSPPTPTQVKARVLKALKQQRQQIWESLNKLMQSYSSSDCQCADTPQGFHRCHSCTLWNDIMEPLNTNDDE